MKSAGLVLAALLLAIPAVAQDRDAHITAWASRVEMQGENDFEGLTTDFDNGFAMGISINHHVSPWLSIEGSVFSAQDEARLVIDDNASVGLGRVTLTPILAGVQLHLPQHDRFDPYVGGGAAYIVAGDLSSPDLLAGGVGRIELEDQFGYYLNAGVGIRIAGGFGIVVDGRYMPFEPSSRSEITGVERDLELSPRLLSVGLRLRF